MLCNLSLSAMLLSFYAERLLQFSEHVLLNSPDIKSAVYNEAVVTQSLHNVDLRRIHFKHVFFLFFCSAHLLHLLCCQLVHHFLLLKIFYRPVLSRSDSVQASVILLPGHHISWMYCPSRVWSLKILVFALVVLVRIIYLWSFSGSALFIGTLNFRFEFISVLLSRPVTFQIIACDSFVFPFFSFSASRDHILFLVASIISSLVSHRTFHKVMYFGVHNVVLLVSIVNGIPYLLFAHSGQVRLPTGK